MSFNSITFLIFFSVFFTFWPVAKREECRRWTYIVIFSFLFYGWWDWRFLFLLIAIGVINYLGAQVIFSSSNFKKAYIVAVLFANLGLLSFFKYSYFLSDSLCAILKLVNLEVSITPPPDNIILPIGISFYTFQAMSYVIDIYCGRLQPTKSMMHYFAYLSMFPQLLAGPIVRASDMLHQLARNSISADEDLWLNFKLVVLGYFQKVVIADNLSPFVNLAFSRGPDQGSIIYWWVVVIAFSFQIYFDFCGYSNIARGIIGLMGYRVKLNFNNPYISTSLREFWTRWHMSLSTWFRDYVYIPLGGNTKGPVKAIFNMWITMLLSGLWHGAALNFVFWGAIHAFWLTIERLTAWPQVVKQYRIGFFIAWIIVFLQVVLAWVFFKADNFQEGIDVIKRLFLFKNSEIHSSIDLKVIGILIFVLFWEWSSLVSEAIKNICNEYYSSNRDIAMIVFLVWTCVFLRGNGTNFIYFQF